MSVCFSASFFSTLSHLFTRWQEQYHGELMRQMAELLQRVDQTYAEV